MAFPTCEALYARRTTPSAACNCDYDNGITNREESLDGVELFEDEGVVSHDSGNKESIRLEGAHMYNMPPPWSHGDGGEGQPTMITACISGPVAAVLI